MRSTLTIVLADDHPSVRKGTREFLESDENLRVVAEAGDGEKAFALALQHNPDVLVLDIQMPIKNGIEVARLVRAQKLHCGILIVSAYDDAPYVKSALQAGANGYILKTAEPEELIQAVYEVYEGQFVLDQRLTISFATLPTAALSNSVSRMVREALTPREVEVVQLIARGLTNKAIATQLEISDRTVQGHIANIFDKLYAESRTDAVMIALRAGWIANT